ncbi:sigma 54-interacting transcriptional regulator [Halobacteriovorax marinus]|uniref:sigma 54-interacting transcriptional regulator n=1 Tax=Halobacteriovorax marinus TaxID=97084 RepID=UPI003A8FD801
MQALYDSKYPILIQGETGTGKTLLAKKIHQRSIRSNQNFIQCNLAGLTHSLFESELFGHLKGAFTGAIENKVGFCEQVSGGTLFFDEIGEIDLNQQKKLLQLLDSGDFYKVGASVKTSFNGRFIFATHRNLEEMVERGEFREDLFHRLGGVAIRTKSLKEKSSAQREEILEQFIEEIKLKNNLINIAFSGEVRSALIDYSWPGNYREMKNTLELLMLKKSFGVIEKESLPRKLLSIKTSSSDFKRQIELLERKILVDELVNKGVGVNKASKSLGISKTTLIAKLRKYGISGHLEQRNTLKAA